MGARVKTFASTGIAPDGKLFAGDLNAIQDAKADTLDFAQVVSLGTLRVGNSSLTIVKFADSPLEARITAALRTDGILRGLGGMFAGTFTTTQRDAIAAGSRPYGLVILNTTTNRLEINLGSDAAPSWQPTTANMPTDTLVPTGAIIPFGGSSAPAGWLMADGTVVSRTTYAALFAVVGTTYNTGGEAGTDFRLPNGKGKVLAGRDAGQTEFSTLGGSGGVKTVTLTAAEMPAHAHGGGDHGHGFPGGQVLLSHQNTGFSSGVWGFVGGDFLLYYHGGTANSGTIISTEGGGGAHSNLQPYLVINHIIKT